MFPGAPNSTNACFTNAPRRPGSLTDVLSFPSEKVPAPPSPNWTLHSGLSSLENDRLHAGQREMIGREETAGAAADHDRPVGRKFLSMFGKTVDLRMN